MAAEILQKFTQTIVTAFCDHIQPLLDQFLAKGLVNDEVYQRILESNSASKAKARSMLSAIKGVIEIDDRCFDKVLSILEDIFTSDNKLVLDLKEEHQKYESQPPPTKRPKLRRVSSDPVIRLSVNADHQDNHSEFTPARRHTAVLPEVRVIQLFTPDLVNVLKSIVDNASDLCLSKGIILESTHGRLLEPTSGTSEERVRKLLQVVRSSINVDRKCYKIFLSVLRETVPPAIRDKLLSDITIEYENLLKAGFKPECPNIDSASDQLLQEFELASNFKRVVNEFKESVEEYTRVCIEKEVLEDDLAKKQNENEELKKDLEMAKAEGKDDKIIRELQERVTICESEIKGIMESIVKIDKRMEKHSMKVKRGESFAQEEYREVSDSCTVAQKAGDENTAKIQDLNEEIEQLRNSEAQLKKSKKQLEDSIKEYELVNKHLMESIVKKDKMIEQLEVKRRESFAQEEYWEVSDSCTVAQKAGDENTAKIQDLNEEIKQRKNLEAQVQVEDSKDYELVINHLHCQLHSPYCTCLKGGIKSFIAKYVQ